MTRDELQAKINEIVLWNYNHLLFDEQEHNYYVDGVNYPSASGFVNELRSAKDREKFESKEFQEFLAPYALNGTLVHKATELLDRGINIDLYEYGEDNYTKIKQYQKHMEVLKEAGYEIVAIELPLFSKTYGVCGTIDRLLYNHKTNTIVLADIKTGSTRPEHWYQQIIYTHLLDEWGIDVDDVVLLSLKLKVKIPFMSDLKQIDNIKYHNKVRKLLKTKEKYERE